MTKNAIIIGGNKIALALLDLLGRTDVIKIIGIVVDQSQTALVTKRLRDNRQISVFSNWHEALNFKVDIVIETTGNEKLFNQLRSIKESNWVIIPASVVQILSNLMKDTERSLISKLCQQTHQLDLILNSIHDGMIAIDTNEIITLFNRSAELMSGIKSINAIGKKITDVIPASRLPYVFRTGKTELNREHQFENGTRIITTRIPLINKEEKRVGAFAVFKDVTDMVLLAEELTNIKNIQTMLEAILNSSEEAITVVDENGKGLIVNPAYTKVTGLKEDDFIGKPVATDISEDENIHMQVLRSRKPIRGARLKVGPNRKDVLVNVAPVIVNGKLKGSVGVIQDMSEIYSLSKELKRARQIIRTLEAKYSFDDIVGDSEEIQFAKEQARLGAMTSANILLRGETGTGKELFAHAIHNTSKRRFNKFIKVNCAALSTSVLEMELFGYEENISGVKKEKKGLFEEANNGTIFIDEIGELSSSTQEKFLRVLQENEIIRIGGTIPIPIDVRVIAATKVNLEKMILKGIFRENLYYRLNGLPIHIPSLRERKSDIHPISTRLLQKINQDYGRNIKGLTEDAIQYLESYDWPGNIRELENVLARAVIHMDVHENQIRKIDIPTLSNKNSGISQQEYKVQVAHNMDLNDQIEQFEKQVIKQTLEANNGNKTNTAKSLGISLRNLYYKLEKYNLA